MIWLLFAMLTACVILVVTRPLSRGGAATGEESPEIEAYKLQLQELDRDLERGTIEKAEAEETRTEISRRLLKANRQKGASTAAPVGSFNANYAFLAIAVGVGIAAVGLYARFGGSGLPDEPLEARLNAPSDRQSLDIQIANIERRLRIHPEDAGGWSVLAPVYLKTGQYEKAANAFRKTIELNGEREDKLYGLFEALTFGNNGIVPPGAKAVLDRALALNRKSPQGLLWLALLAKQDGNKSEAEGIFRQLLNEDIPPALKTAIEEQIAALNAGGDVQTADNQSETQDGRSAMIRGMVERLAARLKENGADLDGWLRIIRSYAVLKENGKAQEAAETARRQFASDPKALERIDGLASAMGVPGEEPDFVRRGRGITGDEVRPDQSAMIRGMVEGLAARLKDNGSDLNGWLMLIRSYAVLQETGKAQEAAATARRNFASEPGALEQIESLAHGLGLSADAKGAQPKS